MGEIALTVGARDLSTVSHGVKTSGEALKKEPAFRQQVEEVSKRLFKSRIQA